MYVNNSRELVMTNNYIDDVNLNKFDNDVINDLLAELQAVNVRGLDGRGNNYYTIYSNTNWDNLENCKMIALLRELSKLRNGRYHNENLSYLILEVNTRELNGEREWHRLDLTPVRK